MSVTREEVLKIAHLARLDLSDDQVAKYTGELNHILGYIETLNKLDTKSVPPTSAVSHASETLRPDIAIQTSTELKEKVFRQAPDSDGEFFKVPQVIG